MLKLFKNKKVDENKFNEILNDLIYLDKDCEYDLESIANNGCDIRELLRIKKTLEEEEK